MKRICILLLVILAFGAIHAQESTIDQTIKDLETRVKTARGKEKAGILNELSFIYRSRSPQKSIEYGKQALALSLELKNKGEESTAAKYICRSYLMLGDNKQALEYAQRSVSTARESKNQILIAAALNAAGIVHANMRDYDRSLSDFQEALKIYEDVKYIKGIADSFNDIGAIYYFKAEYEKAVEFFLKSLETKKEMGDRWGQAASFSNIGTIYIQMGYLDSALKAFLDALEIGEEIGDKRETAKFLSHIGTTYRELRKYRESLEYFEKALNVQQEMGNKPDIANTLGHIGLTYFKLNNYQKALEYFQQSLAKMEEVGDKLGLAGIFNNLGMAYSELGQYDQALDYLQRALQIETGEIADKSGSVTSFWYIGRTYTKLREYAKALDNLRQGLNISKEIKDNDKTRLIYLDLSGLYAATGNYKNAYESHTRYSELNDTIYNEKSSRQVAEMQTRYETLKKEKEIALLTKNNEIQNLTLGKERNARNALILGLVLVSTFLGLLFRKYLYLFAFWKKQKYVGQFRLMEEIGTGGMGTIYKAHSFRDKKETVAIKVLKPELFENESSRKRFKQEGAIIDKLDHPNIVRILERGEYKDKLFIAMELLRGKTLKVKIEEEDRMDLKECLHIMIQVSDALVLIHGKEIIHRDLKPSNIMLIEKDGNPNFVKLLDFGLARTKYQTKITRTGMLIGTIDYISPEQLTGETLSTASDVYSLGVTFYEMITGTMAFPGETANDVIKQILDKTPVEPRHFRPDIPAELNDLTIIMLEKKKEARPSIATVLDTLQTIRYKYKM